MKPILNILFLFTIICTFYGCKTQEYINDSLRTTKWKLIKLNGKDADSLFPQKVPEIEFNIAEKKIFGYGGCNEYVGNYTLTGDKFYAPSLMSTTKMCTSRQYEDLYIRMLSKKLQLSVNSEELTLSEKGKAVLIFKKMNQVSSENIEKLSGEWKLETIEGKNVSEYFKTENTPIMIFDLSSSFVKGNAGCNGYQGDFSFSKNELEIDKIKMTRMYCENIEGERLFINLLSGKSDIKISNNSLIFNKGKRIVLSFQKKQ